jgi:hypothetical protein
VGKVSGRATAMEQLENAGRDDHEWADENICHKRDKQRFTERICQAEQHGRATFNPIGYQAAATLLIQHDGQENHKQEGRTAPKQ